MMIESLIVTTLQWKQSHLYVCFSRIHKHQPSFPNHSYERYLCCNRCAPPRGFNKLLVTRLQSSYHWQLKQH